MDWGSIISVGSNLLGSFLSNDSANNTSERAAAGTAASEARLAGADARLAKAMDNLSSLTPPNLQQFILPYQQAVAVGQLTPEEAVFKMQEDTATAGINVPQELLDAQRNALTKITQIAEQGGITAIDRARLNDIQNEQSARSRGEQEAIVQNAAQRGVGGSGIEMASRLLSQQGAATRSAAAGTDVAAEAQKRQLEALAASGTMATTQRTQDVNEQARVAEARDAINKFNTSFQNSTNAANVASRNSAQAANLQEAQRLQEFNIGQREREAAARAAAAQTGWQNTMNQATGLTNAAAGQASGALTASLASNTAAEKLNQTADAQRAAAIQQAGQGVGDLVNIWKDKDKEKETT